jgi:RHS repeat-associated protein
LVSRVHGNDHQLETDYASNITYDKFGQRVLLVTGNGTRSTYAYRRDNRRLANVQATLPVGYTFNNFNFSYDNVGNLAQLQNTAQPPGSFTAGNLGNAIGGPWTKTFSYDDLYRLTISTGTHSVAPTQTYTYSFSQAYDSIHNITHKTQTAMQGTAVNPQTTYDFAYSYPAPGSARPHAPTAIGPFTISNDADGNQVNTLGTGTSDQSEYLYDEENRLSCANKGPQAPSPSCNAQGNTQFIYDHAGVRKVKVASSPTIYPNQYYTDFGGGAGNQFKHIFIGSERILTKKARVAPDRQHWYYYHPDHLGSTAMVTNENSQLVDALHYFPFGEVWLEERPSSLPADYFFTAKEFDPETGFYNFGARYLDPRFSKWMTTDPALRSYMPGARVAVAYQFPTLANSWRGHPDLPGLGGTFTPSNLALYGYGHQNPATLADPNGKAATTAAGCMVGGGIGSLFGGVGALPGCGIGALISTAATVVGVIIVGGVLLSSDTPMSSSGSSSAPPTPAISPSAGTGNPQFDPENGFDPHDLGPAPQKPRGAGVNTPPGNTANVTVSSAEGQIVTRTRFVSRPMTASEKESRLPTFGKCRPYRNARHEDSRTASRGHHEDYGAGAAVHSVPRRYGYSCQELPGPYNLSMEREWRDPELFERL